MLCCHGAAGLQQLLMTQMDTVKKSQGVDVFFHNITCYK